ncbi:MAG TPA: selenide, water dikinase SelD [Kofleriaceae bacterium]|nr:selenide, water dikinase SelD [Kofleriaceae bacterium]
MGDLVQVLERLHAGGMARPAAGDASVLVSTDFADDAAVVRLGGGADPALVMTADVIAPLVDDPETFGRIAATNAISDVYAMGGRPLYALNLVFFPDDLLPFSVLEGILRGGAAACAEAGVAIVGGHTVRDAEVKYGLSVTGVVDPAALLSNRTAQAGQRLVLSKALGTGIIGQAIKKGVASAAEASAAVESMTTHNRGALEAARRAGVTSCTDVTGFGLLGHLRNILRGSGLRAAIDLSALPLLAGAREYAAAGLVPAGSKSNLEFIGPSLRGRDGLGPDGELALLLACDAQTSGGLLLTVPGAAAAQLVADLGAQGLPAADVGELLPAAAEGAGAVGGAGGDGDVGAIELRYTRR